MGLYCRICGRTRANEKFSGRGHRARVCRDCEILPREARDHIERMDELDGLLNQSNISQQNIKRVEVLAQHPSSEVKELAILLLEIARVKPHKRRRWKFLAQRHPDLLVRMRALRGDDFPGEL
jgi:hypothetical protein